jgi:uncharacterized protein (TIGR02145 family)
LPSQAEFQELLDVVGGFDNLKSSAWGGPDSYGFSALPAGKYDAIAGGTFTTWQMQTGWWLQSGSFKALYAVGPDFADFRNDDGVNGFSVRCLKDTPNISSDVYSENLPASSFNSIESSSGNVEEVTDSREPVIGGAFVDERDGQTYKYVVIQSQTWMAENLNFEYKIYDEVYGTYSNLEFGRYYTWGAAMDSARVFSYGGKFCGDSDSQKIPCNPTYPVRGICPQGWHLPDVWEWKTLIDGIGGSSEAGTKLKATSGWETLFNDGQIHSSNGTDIYGFSVFPAGYYDYSGTLFGAHAEVRFWTSTPCINEYGVHTPSANSVSFGYDGVSYYYDDSSYHPENYRKEALAVRCVKD